MKFRYLVIIAVILGSIINFKNYFTGTGTVSSNVANANTTNQSNLEIKPGATYRAKINRQVDADTSKFVFIDKNNKPVSEEYTLRILNIDTPETKKPNTPVQPFGHEASEYAHNLLDGKIVTIEVSEKTNPVDKYNRLLGYLYINGKMYEELVVSKGLGKVAYLYKPDTKYSSKLYKAQDAAKKKKIGIWSIKGYAEPENGYNMNVIK